MNDALATAAQSWWRLMDPSPAWAATRRVQRFWQHEVVEPEVDEQTWATDNEVVLEHPRFRLRSFGPVAHGAAPGEGAAERPVLIVPPEINGPQLPDYGADQSLVRTLQAAGFQRVYVLGWLTATRATRGDDVEGSIDAIEACVDALGGRVHLLGICQGGWVAAIVAARRPDAVSTLTLAAAPIDFRAGGGALTRLVDWTPPEVYAAYVALGGGVMRSDLLREGFTNLRFGERRVLAPWLLWNRLDDEGWMDRRARMRRWYFARKDLPGVAYLRIVQQLFRENRLIEGTFTVHGDPVRLDRITAPAALIAGSHDHITLPAQLWALEQAGSCRATRRWTVPGGHIGVVVGHEPLREHWPGIAQWLLEQGD